jgi:integrase
MILVMANTGMRFEEAAGLTWNCIDFDNQTIKIDKAWNYQKKPADFGATKNRSSNRSVHVDQQTMATLRKLKVINDKRQLLRPDYNPKHLAFIRPETGLPITNDGLNTVLANICGKLDIYPDSEDHKHNYTSHSLRHTHASLLFYEKRDIAYISKRLGHESISTTYKTYVHVIKELSARNDNAIDGIISDLYNQS